MSELLVGKNVNAKIEDNVLTITINLNEDFGKSSTGKTTIVATTGGYTLLPGNSCRLNLNLIKK